jgi:homoserine kinase type II
MNVAYPLWHVRRDDEYGDNAKLIGVYSSSEEAQQAVERLADQPGFRDHPDGFQFEPYEINKDHWTEGFVDVSNAAD